MYKMIATEKKLIAVLLATLSLLIFIKSEAQIEQPVRYEVELESEDDFFNVMSVEEYGIVLTRKVQDVFEKGKSPWQFVALDTSLYERWSTEVFIDFNYELRGFDNVDNMVYYLFKYPQYRPGGDLIIEIDATSGMYQQYVVNMTLDFQLTEFEVIQNSAVFGGYVNMRPTVVQYFFKEGRTKVYPGLYYDRSRLLQVDVNNSRGVITIISSIRTFEKKNTIAIRKFDTNGEMIENFDLEPREKTSLIDARNITVNNTDILAGTYSGKNIKYSRGIFLAYIDEEGEEVINYYNYAELENFFSYMKARKEKRVKERIERKKIKGKKLKFNYRLLVHDIVPFGDHYILLGEAYYPKYNNYSSYGGFYSYYPSSSFSGYERYYFEGYQYTHAVVIGFDDLGKLLWDNSFEINDAMSYNLRQFVHVDPQEDKIVLLYNYENVIRSKLIEGDEVIEGKAFNDISLKFQDDVVKNNESEYGGLEKWYKNRFFAYGVQKIKNMKDAGVKLNRKVFFINKIIYN